MPKLTRQFYLEVTVEQFLSACTYLELQEINMRLDAHLRRAERSDPSHRMTEIQTALDTLPEPLQKTTNL